MDQVDHLATAVVLGEEVEVEVEAVADLDMEAVSKRLINHDTNFSAKQNNPEHNLHFMRNDLLDPKITTWQAA